MPFLTFDPWLPSYLVLCFLSYSSESDVYTFPLSLSSASVVSSQASRKVKGNSRLTGLPNIHPIVVEAGAVAFGIGLPELSQALKRFLVAEVDSVYMSNM